MFSVAIFKLAVAYWRGSGGGVEGEWWGSGGGVEGEWWEMRSCEFMLERLIMIPSFNISYTYNRIKSIIFGLI